MDMKVKLLLVCVLLSAISVCRVDGETILSKNKQSYAVTMVTGTKGYGNDGDKTNCDPMANSMHFQTDHVHNPWWSVDVGASMRVTRVDLTTVVDPNFGIYTQDIVVGLTKVNPSNAAPVFGTYFKCRQHPGDLGVGVTVSFPCPANAPLYRFVVVQRETSSGAMALCEVEVFGHPEIVTATKKKKKGRRCLVFLYRAKHRKACRWFKQRKNRSTFVRRQQFQKRQRQLRRQQRRG